MSMETTREGYTVVWGGRGPLPQPAGRTEADDIYCRFLRRRVIPLEEGFDEPVVEVPCGGCGTRTVRVKTPDAKDVRCQACRRGSQSRYVYRPEARKCEQCWTRFAQDGQRRCKVCAPPKRGRRRKAA